MENITALEEARRLHALGIDHDKINLHLIWIATPRERREILATLDMAEQPIAA